jgi:hypothetical protein
MHKTPQMCALRTDCHSSLGEPLNEESGPKAAFIYRQLVTLYAKAHPQPVLFPQLEHV